MDLSEELLSGFEFLNLTLTEDVLKKCEDLCNIYNIEPEDFVNIWCAHAASTMCTDGPTVEKLEIMEKKSLQKYRKDKQVSKTPSKTPKKAPSVINNLPKAEDETAANTSNNDTLLTKDKIELPEPEILDESISNHLSSTQATKYVERSDSLSVKAFFGKEPPAYTSMNNERIVDIKYFDEENFLRPEAKYMYEVLGQKITCLSNLTNELGTVISKKSNVQIDEKQNKNHIGVTAIYGQIVVDGKGHLNAESISLEGTIQINSGNVIHLNIEKLPRVALFPGQIVVVKGKMLSENKLVADVMLSDGSLNLPLEPPVIKDSLRIIVASGPYTVNENLNYDPMRDFLNYVADNSPNVLILMGPFVDENHPSVYFGNMQEALDVFFEQLIESISAALQDTTIRIIIISSMRDAHHHNVYPTPPYKTRENHENIKFVSDPCMLNIDGLILGATSADILYHIAKEEFTTMRDGDTMGRLASHIIQQHNFYPLYPPNIDMNVSHQLLEAYGVMKCLPHLLILPSMFKGFIRNIKDCVVVNPERLTRENGGGAFADITICPGTSRSITNRVSCKILKI